MALFDDVKRKVLENGLEVLVREDHSAPVVALNFFVRVGSLNEDDAIAGWSHGIEHMLFKGTERRGPGDIAREIANAGGETNAGTGYESTNYYIILPSQNFETALDIHSDVLMHSTFDEHELENERQVLIKENEMYRDRPSGFGFTWEELLDEAFTTHRYRRPIGGPDENLLRVGRDQILDYKKTYYVPNNITYVVVGDVRTEDVFRVIEEEMGSWPRSDLDPDVSPSEPPQKALRYREKKGDVEKTYVKIGFHVPEELDPETDALLTLGHVLASGRSSRLYRRVREEKGLILDTGTMEATGRDPGYMMVEFTAEPEKVQEALLATLEEILRFQDEPVTASELERTLRAVRSQTLSAMETMEGQAQMLGHYAVLGDHALAGAYLERLSRVTPQRVREAARKHLTLEQATVFAYGPEGTPALAADASSLFRMIRDGATAGRVESLAPISAESAAAAFPSGSGRGREEVEALTLDSGTRVLLQPDGRLPLVALAVYLPGGSGSEGAHEAGITRLTQNCMMKGAGGRSAAEIAEALDLMGARMQPASNRDTSGWSLGAVREDLPQAMDLLEDVLARPEFPAEAVHRERGQTLVEIASLRDDTMQYTASEFFRLIFPGHAYGRLALGLEESVKGLEPEHLRACHADIYGPSRLVVSVVGDFERDDMLRRLEKLVGALPRADAGLREILPVTNPGEPVRNDLLRQVSQAVVVLGYPGPEVDSSERYALDVWQGIMSGMGNRLFTRLRDEQHLCYFTGAFTAPFLRGGVVGAYVGTGPEQVEQATDSLLTELETSARELPDTEELARAKNNLAGSYLTGMQTRMSWASTYAHDETLGLGYQEALRYVDEIRTVTPEMVRESAARYVDRSRLAVAVLRPSGDSVSVGVEA
jgi:zinc protease